MFPTAALLYVKVGFSLFGPFFARLGDNRFYLLAATVALIWIALGSNLVGLKVGKWTENIGALAAWAVGLLLVDGGMDGVDAPRFGDSYPYSSEMELGNRQFLGGNRLCDVRHGKPRHDGR